MKVTDNIQKASDASSLVQKAWSSGLNTIVDAGAEGLQIYYYWYWTEVLYMNKVYDI